MAFPTSPKAYWKLEDVNDTLGVYTLTNTDTTTFTAGKINNAATFNGSSQALNNNSVWGATGYPKSYSGWVKFDTVASGGDQAIFAIGDGSVHYYCLKLRDSDNKIVFRSNNNSDAGDVDTGITADATTWYHVAVVQHSATSVSLYVNGSKTNTTATTFSATVSQFYIGYLGRSSVWWLDGQVDEVGFWDKALSDAEVTSLYNSGNGASDYLTLANVSYWKLDESSGNASDSVGSNTLTNSDSSYVTGKINNGAEMSGSDRLYANDSASLSLTGNHTIAFWINWSSVAQVNTFINKFNSVGNQQSWLYRYGDNSGTKQFLVNLSSNGSSNTQKTYNYTYSTGTWYHIAFVYTAAAGTVDIYSNGSILTQLTGLPTSIFDSTASLEVGGYDNGSNTASNATYDEIGIWSRALTADEVEDLYKDGDGWQYPFLTGNVYSLACAVGSYTLTGIDTIFTKAMRMIASAGSYTLTGIDIIFQRGYGIICSAGAFILSGLPIRFTGQGGWKWRRQAKSSTSWSNQTKSSTTWSNQSKS